MKYTEIIKSSKFYIPMNLNLGYLLEDTEIMLLMTIIHCSELKIKVSVPKLEQFTARSQSTIKRRLRVLKDLRLVSEDYKPCLEQIGIVYNAVNSAKTIKERKAWCEAYKSSKGQIEPLKEGQGEPNEQGQIEPMKEGQSEPTKKGQFEPTDKEYINKEDFNKEYIDNEYTNNEDILKYNNRNILKEKIPSKANSKKLKEDFELVTEGVNENQNETKPKVEGNDDSNRYQPFENNLLSPSENSKITKTLESLDCCKNTVDSNTFNECMRLLLEVATSSKDSYMNNATKVKKDFNEVMKGCSREQRKPFSEALNNLVSILGTAFHN